MQSSSGTQHHIYMVAVDGSDAAHNAYEVVTQSLFH